MSIYGEREGERGRERERERAEGVEWLRDREREGERRSVVFCNVGFWATIWCLV